MACEDMISLQDHSVSVCMKRYKRDKPHRNEAFIHPEERRGGVTPPSSDGSSHARNASDVFGGR